MAVSIKSVTTATVDTGSATVAATTPASPAAAVGDVLLIFHGNNFYAASNMPTPTVSPTATVNAITNGTADAGTNLAHVKAYTAVVATAGQQTVSVTETGTADEEKCMVVYVLSGVDTTTPVDAAGNATGASATNQPAASVSPSTANALLICHNNNGGATSTTAYTTPSGMTEEYELHPNFFSGVGGSEQLTSSGATGTRTFVGATACPWGAVSVAVKSVAGPTHPYKVANRGSAGNITSEASTAVTMAAAGSITTGNYLIARLSANNSGASGAAVGLTVSDPRSNSWTVLTAANQDPGAANAGITCFVAYTKVTNAYTNNDAITFQYSPNCTGKYILIEEWGNVHATAPLAVSEATAVGAGTAPTGSRTPTANDQTMYVALATEGPIGDTYTEDSDTTDGTWSSLTREGLNETPLSSCTTAGAFKQVTGTTAQSWGATITSRDWATVAFVLDPADTGTNAPAENATGTGAANAPTVTVEVNPGAASGTGAAENATLAAGVLAEGPAGVGAAFDPSIVAESNAFAECATGTGAAGSPTVAITTDAALASGTGAAFDATVSTATVTSAPAECATGTGTAEQPNTAVSFSADPALATGSAVDGTALVGGFAEVATGSGSAGDVAASMSVNAGAAEGVGAAPNAVASLLIPAGVASGVGAAFDPSFGPDFACQDFASTTKVVTHAGTVGVVAHSATLGQVAHSGSVGQVAYAATVEHCGR